jgi:hypothetical protein
MWLRQQAGENPTAPRRGRALASRLEPKCQRLMSVPGIGPLISTALVAAIGTGEAFDRSRPRRLARPGVSTGSTGDRKPIAATPIIPMVAKRLFSPVRGAHGRSMIVSCPRRRVICRLLRVRARERLSCRGRGAPAPLCHRLGTQTVAGGQGVGALFRCLELGSNTRRRAGCAVKTCCQNTSSP